MVNVLIQNIFTSGEHDCNFKALEESSCGALTGGRLRAEANTLYILSSSALCIPMLPPAPTRPTCLCIIAMIEEETKQSGT